MYTVSSWHETVLGWGSTSPLWRCPIRSKPGSTHRGKPVPLGPSSAPQGYTEGRISVGVTGWSQSARPCNRAPSPGRSLHHTAGKTEREGSHPSASLPAEVGTTGCFRNKTIIASKKEATAQSPRVNWLNRQEWKATGDFPLHLGPQLPHV